MDEISDSLYRIIGKHLRDLRNDKGFTLVELGEKSNIPFKTIQRYEVGDRKISNETLKLLLTLLSKDYDEFMVEVKTAFLSEEAAMYNHQFNTAKEAISYILHQIKVKEYCNYEDDIAEDSEEWKSFVNDILEYIKFRSLKL